MRDQTKSRTVECLACDECDNTWLFPATINRYSATSIPMGMQASGVHADSDISVLICIACGRAVFPVSEGFQIPRSTQALYTEMFEEVSRCGKELGPEPAITDKEAVGAWAHIPTKQDR